MGSSTSSIWNAVDCDQWPAPRLCDELAILSSEYTHSRALILTLDKLTLFFKYLKRKISRGVVDAPLWEVQIRDIRPKEGPSTFRPHIRRRLHLSPWKSMMRWSHHHGWSRSWELSHRRSHLLAHLVLHIIDFGLSLFNRWGCVNSNLRNGNFLGGYFIGGSIFLFLT